GFAAWAAGLARVRQVDCALCASVQTFKAAISHGPRSSPDGNGPGFHDLADPVRFERGEQRFELAWGTGRFDRHRVGHDVDDVGAEELDHRSEEHTSELQSRFDLVCRLLLEKKNNTKT